MHDDLILNFPMPFDVKALGYDNEDFSSLVFTLVQKHVPDLSETALTYRHSRGGKYLSITVHFEAQSQTQVDAIYQELGSQAQVLMIL
jgi:hypothetical protein